MTSDSSSSASYVQFVSEPQLKALVVVLIECQPGLAPVKLQQVTQPQGKTGSNNVSTRTPAQASTVRTAHPRLA